MEKINFDDIILINEINKIDTQNVKCISEHNSSDSQNYKCLNFEVSYEIYNFGIRIFIQENDNNITVELLAENICKNIDVDDDAMELIISQITIITKLVKNKLEEYISIISEFEKTNKSIEIDSMIINNNIEIDKLNLEEIKNKIDNLYNTLKPDKVEYSNYTNKLYLFSIGIPSMSVTNEYLEYSW